LRRHRYWRDHSPNKIQLGLTKIINKGDDYENVMANTVSMSLDSNPSPIKRMMSPDKRINPQSFMPKINEGKSLNFKLNQLRQMM